MKTTGIIFVAAAILGVSVAKETESKFHHAKRSSTNSMPASKWVLDEMEQLHGEIGASYPIDTFERMQRCLVQYSDGKHDLQKTLELGWEGMIEYGMSGGALDGSDNWFKEDQFPDRGWREFDPKPLAFDNVTYPGAADIICYEPCNYSSNIAYHRTMIEICERGLVEPWTLEREYVQAFVEVYNILGMGSAFYHASNTRLGGEIDVVPIQAFALLFVQSSLSSFPDNPILKEIRSPSDPALRFTSYGYVDFMTDMINEKSVYDWLGELRSLDLPNYYLSFSGFVVIGLDIMFIDNPELADTVTKFLASLILNDAQTAFLIDEYLPEFRRVRASEGITFGGEDRKTLGNMFVGTVLKMVYAFYWQESIVPGPHISDPEAIARGAEMLPVVNALANQLTGFYHVDEEFQQSINVFPGDARCRAEQGHAIWQEESGNGLVDMALVAQFVDSVFRSSEDDNMTVEAGLVFCLIENDCLDGVMDGDFANVLGCIQRIPIFNPNPPCGDKVDTVALLGCIPGCAEGETECLASCVMDNAEIGVKVVPRRRGGLN